MRQVEGVHMATKDPKQSFAPCIAFIPGQSATPVGPADLRWPEGKREINVFFRGKIPTWRLTPKTDPNENFISTSDILKWANTWSAEDREGIVPAFVPVMKEKDSDIRVQLGGNSASWSRLGILAAAEIFKEQPTMVLNLRMDDDDEREYTVVHEFGHALGLGHEHQMSYLANALDEKATIEWLMKTSKLTKENAKAKFQADYCCHSTGDDAPEQGREFDASSIMCYPIALECIRDKERFTKEQRDMLTNCDFSKRKFPSATDKATICSLYKAQQTDIIPIPITDLKAGPTAADEKPGFPELFHFQGNYRVINVIDEIGTKYFAVGTDLLKDRRGTKISALERQYRRNPNEITAAIMRKWVSGQGIEDRTWRGLVEVLKDNDCVALAEDIEEAKAM